MSEGGRGNTPCTIGHDLARLGANEEGWKPEGYPPPRIGCNRLALIRNQAFTGAKAEDAGCAGEEDGSSGPSSVAQLRRVDRMPEAR
jgi:hypothetical protein